MKHTSHSRKLSCRVVAGAALVAGLCISVEASADPNAPGYVQTAYGLSCTPQCTLCHATNAGGFANIRKIVVNGQSKGGFITTLEADGFVPTDQSTWGPAFAKCEANKTDTDGDGTPDIQELKMGDDPNDPAPGAALCGNGPVYGCVHVARRGSVDGVALFVSSLVLLGGIAAARRRAR
jgi:hypothetical protein